MPKKGYKQTEEHKAKTRSALKGKKRPPFSKERRENMSAWQRGRKLSNSHRLNISKSQKGKIISLETREKIRLSKLGKKMRPFSEQARLNQSLSKRGSKSYLWKGGINPINDSIRKSFEYKLWARAVKERDNFVCQKYGIKGDKLVTHHIQNFAQCPELRFITDNGITLSDKAHKEFHGKYGIKNNTKEQIEEFLQV